jgi:hypothetical protein
MEQRFGNAKKLYEQDHVDVDALKTRIKQEVRSQSFESPAKRTGMKGWKYAAGFAVLVLAVSACIPPEDTMADDQWPEQAKQAKRLMESTTTHFHTLDVWYSYLAGPQNDKQPTTHLLLDLDAARGLEYRKGQGFTYLMANGMESTLYDPAENEYIKQTDKPPVAPDRFYAIRAWLQKKHSSPEQIPAFQNSVLFPWDLFYNLMDSPQSVKALEPRQIAGRKAIGIEITPSDVQEQKVGVQTLFVDAETGVMLEKWAVKDGKTEQHVRVQEIHYDAPLDEKQFEIPMKPDAKVHQDVQVPQDSILSTCPDSYVPAEIKSEWEQAKGQDKTSIWQVNGTWYIYPKKGYLVDRIQVTDRSGKVILSKSSDAKGTVPAMATGYHLDSLRAE